MSGISKNLKKHIEQKTLRRKGYTYIWKLMRFVLLVGLSFMILYPVFVKFSASLKSTADMMDSTVVFIPKNPTLQNYKIVLNSVNYALTLLMTVLFCLVQSLLQLASCSLVAYGIARFKFKGHKLLFGMAVLTLIIPPQIILLPLYIRFHFFGITNIFQFSGIFSGVDLINTYWPFLLLSGTALGFKNGLYIYLLRQHFKNMPKLPISTDAVPSEHFSGLCCRDPFRCWLPFFCSHSCGSGTIRFIPESSSLKSPLSQISCTVWYLQRWVQARH